MFFVHALRIRTEEVAQRREAANLGRLVDAEALGSSKRRSEAKKAVKKSILDQKDVFCKNCERNIPIHQPFTGFDDMFGVPNVALEGGWENVSDLDEKIVVLELQKRIWTKKSQSLRSQHLFAAAASAWFIKRQMLSTQDLQHLNT